MCASPGELEGIVTTGQGTIHNNPANGIWCGTWAPVHTDLETVPEAEDEDADSEQHTAPAICPEWQLTWKEQLPSNRGHFLYQGVLRDDGTDTVRGSFSWSIMPRKGGQFEFTLARLPPSACMIKVKAG